MRYILVTALLSATTGMAQHSEILAKAETSPIITVFEKEDNEWSEGSVLLNDGTKHQGRVKYNDLTGVVSFESKSGNESYNARTIASFELQDKDNKRRSFYSLRYSSPYDNSLVKQFFEVLREYKDFAVLSRTSAFGERVPVEVETVYLIRATTLEILPFMQVTEHQVKWKLFDANKTQHRLLNASLPKELMGEKFQVVKSFARERNLEWHVKESLISILDYYDSIR